MPTTINVQSRPGIKPLIRLLRSRDPIQRAQARRSLVEMGKAATPDLTRLLTDRDEHVRWEAAKALVQIADPAAIPALIEALNDESADVRWLAAKAMIALRRDALQPLLTALIERSKSIHFCRSAHHVLCSLARRRHDSILSSVIESLESGETGVTVPPAAEAVLAKLRQS